MNLPDALHPPLLTAELPGVGGLIKQKCDDFEVEEVPAYEPSGSGDHLYLWVEKRDLGAEYFTRLIAKRLNILTGDVGTAGLKDRHAITRQYVSVPAAAEGALPGLEGDGIRVLQVARHGNKLRPGHLRGNRFRVLIRNADRSREEPLRACIEAIRRDGLPNYYGPQRFGHDGETADLGWRLLAKQQVRVRSLFLRKLALSAVQSSLFNVYLGRRLREGLLRTVLEGDVMAKWPAGGLFTAADVRSEQARFDRREIVAAGPIFGRKTFAAAGIAAEREAATLTESGLTPESFDGFGKLLQGSRRHNLIYIDDLATEWTAEGLRLHFTLPAGSYATVLLREVMKTEVADDEKGAPD